MVFWFFFFPFFLFNNRHFPGKHCTGVSPPVVVREARVMWPLWTVMKSCESRNDESPPLSMKLTATHAVM